MQPVILTITIVSSNHVHKTVVDTKSGTGTFIKGKYEVHNWLIASTAQFYNPDEGTTQAIIRNWKDGLNSTFPFKPGYSQDAKFKNSKRGTHLKNMPKFSDAPALELASIMSFSPFALTPMSLALQITLNQILASVIKCIDKDLIKFILRYEEDSYLLGNEIWDENFANHITAELWYFRLKKNTLFKKTKARDWCSTNFATINEWNFLHM